METTTVKLANAIDKKFVFLGCGSIAKCTIHFLNKFVDLDYNKVYIVDEIDMRNVPALQDVFKKGANFYKVRLEDDDFDRLFRLFKLKPLDVIVDLTTNTSCYKLIETVRKHSLLYMNTSMEINWHFSAESSVYDESLLKRHIDVENIDKSIADPQNATHCYEFGMNPGLISHFTFQALLDVANLALKEKEDKQLKEFVEKKQYPHIAKHLGVEIVHCSEIDTQISKTYKEGDKTFVNTWSCIGLLEEGLEPVQLGWGTHEKTMPEKGELLAPHMVGIKKPAYKKAHKSYVPDGETVGVCIPHGEGITLTQNLSLEDYSPTIHYVYTLCPQTRDILKVTPFEDLHHVKDWRVMDPLTDQLEGEDKIGCLLVLNKNPLTGEKKNWSYWYGSILGQETSKFFGPTVIQVAAGVLTAIRYMVENPNQGPIYSEKLPTDWVIETARPWLGQIVSKHVPWSPASTQFVDLEVNEA
jgi:homospermidine synthase